MKKHNSPELCTNTRSVVIPAVCKALQHRFFDFAQNERFCHFYPQDKLGAGFVEKSVCSTGFPIAWFQPEEHFMNESGSMDFYEKFTISPKNHRIQEEAFSDTERCGCAVVEGKRHPAGLFLFENHILRWADARSRRHEEDITFTLDLK